MPWNSVQSVYDRRRLLLHKEMFTFPWFKGVILSFYVIVWSCDEEHLCSSRVSIPRKFWLEPCIEWSYKYKTFQFSPLYILFLHQGGCETQNDKEDVWLINSFSKIVELILTLLNISCLRMNHQLVFVAVRLEVKF